MKVFPSLISADILCLRDVIAQLDDHCAGYHIDVMDDHFVPNLTWGPAFAEAIRNATSLPIHLHLMVDNPQAWINRVALQKDDVWIFHHEVYTPTLVTKQGCKLGVAINPSTPVEDIYPYIEHLDHVLVMSVEPGFSGQAFMPEVLQKVPTLVAYRREHNLSFTIGMDGGIGLSNIQQVVDAGVDEVGAASAIFAASDPVEAVQKLSRLS